MKNKKQITPRLVVFENEHFEKLIANYTKAPTTIDYITNYALRAYTLTKKYKLEMYTIEEVPCARDMNKFINLIDESGITEFNLCESSTALMGALCFLLGNGWAIDGTYKKKVDDSTTLQGLHVKKNG